MGRLKKRPERHRGRSKFNRPQPDQCEEIYMEMEEIRPRPDPGRNAAPARTLKSCCLQLAGEAAPAERRGPELCLP